jgi:hypothetical protein
MQRRITQHEKRGTNNRQSTNIPPKRKHIKPETAQNRTTGDFDVEAVLLIDEREVAHFVDDEAFEAEVEDGEL